MTTMTYAGAASALDPLADPTAVEELIGLLDVTPIEPTGTLAVVDPMVSLSGMFEGRAVVCGGGGRAFGGLTAAQAVVAAGRTVAPGRPVHSLHGYFTRRGNSRSPIIYRVENLRDGYSMATRRVVAIQSDAPIFYLTASFHDPDVGLEHQPPPPYVPAPDESKTIEQLLAEVPDELGVLMRSPFDVRYLGAPRWAPNAPSAKGEPQRTWLRVAATLPDDPLIHAGVLAYVSDMCLLGSVLVDHGETWGPGGYAGASIDHSVWFHGPCRTDDWMLWDCFSPWASAGRGLATGRLYTADGRLVMTVAQEGVVRRMPGRRGAAK